MPGGTGGVKVSDSCPPRAGSLMTDVRYVATNLAGQSPMYRRPRSMFCRTRTVLTH